MAYSSENWRAYYEKNKERIKEARRERYAAQPHKERKYTRDHYQHNREEILDKQRGNKKRKAYFRRYYAELKARVIAAYGGQCLCCGDSHFEFLTIDHINGGGRVERKKIGMGAGFYNWLENNGYPKERYRLLCMNCNFALGKYGHCPHQK